MLNLMLLNEPNVTLESNIKIINNAHGISAINSRKKVHQSTRSTNLKLLDVVSQ